VTEISVNINLPPLETRRLIDQLLVVFFQMHRKKYFKRAISLFCRYYRIRQPVIEWFEYIDWGSTGGRTFEDGKVHLVHPENWKKGIKYKSERQWINTVYHELAHFLFWADPERKADTFARRMVRGVRS
jgi:hypothetical protein